MVKYIAHNISLNDRKLTLACNENKNFSRKSQKNKIVKNFKPVGSIIPEVNVF